MKLKNVLVAVGEAAPLAALLPGAMAVTNSQMARGGGQRLQASWQLSVTPAGPRRSSA
jgi:hypothetical protein